MVKGTFKTKTSI